MINHLKTAVPKIDADVGRSLELQCLDEDKFIYGIVTNVMQGYDEPGSGTSLAAKFVSAYYNKYSKWYRNQLLLERAVIAARHTLNRMNADGSLDYMATNFYDSTYNAFQMHFVGPALKLLLRDNEHTPLENEIQFCLTEFTRRSGDAMINLGFHTPNHHWVVSAALAYCYSLLGDERYLAHIKKFIDNEGIDCDENGEFTERSAAIYSIVCDRTLIMMAEELNMPELLDHVARNIRMAVTFMELDDTLNTLNSARQDFGQDPSINGYYEPYLRMALLTEDAQFAYLADYMQSRGASCDMIWFLLHPEFEEKQTHIKTERPCFEYERLYAESGVLRQRIKHATLTLIKDRPLFAKLQFKNKVMLVRFAGSFFGKGQFAPGKLERTENGYRLFCHRSCGYLGPFDEKQPYSNWKDLDRNKRPQAVRQNFDTVFEFKLTDGELKIDIEACTEDGNCPNIPVKLELMFPANCVFENDSTILTTKAGDYVFQKGSPCRITYPEHTKFIIEGGFCEHFYAKNMRGAIPADGKAFTVCFTGFTPQKRSVSIKYSDH